MTKEIQKQLSILESSFNMDDYSAYLNGKLSRQDMLLKYNCSDYLLTIYFKKYDLSTRRANVSNCIKQDYFKNITKESAYILGFYVADGCVSDNKISFTISKKDQDVVKHIRNCISPHSNLCYHEEYINKQGIKSNPLVTLAIPSKEIVNTLVDYGLGYHKTNLSKTITNIVPKEYMWDFIRGYFDGDGCVSASRVKHTVKGKDYYNWNVNWTIISKDKTILEDIQNFIKLEGIDVILYQEKRGNWLMGTHSIKNLPKIFNKLYNDEFCLTRKYEKFKEIIANTETNSKTKKLESL